MLSYDTKVIDQMQNYLVYFGNWIDRTLFWNLANVTSIKKVRHVFIVDPIGGIRTFLDILKLKQ